MKTLLFTLQHLIQTRTYSLYVTYIRAYSTLPSLLVWGNDIADKVAYTVFSSPEKEHKHLLSNANRLHVHYKIPLHIAHDIIKSYPLCAPLHCRYHPSGSNLQGLHINELWQMDVTLITFFHSNHIYMLLLVLILHSFGPVPQSNENVRAVIASLL
jgi:hypothetical protein